MKTQLPFPQFLSRKTRHGAQSFPQQAAMFSLAAPFIATTRPLNELAKGELQRMIDFSEGLSLETIWINCSPVTKPPNLLAVCVKR